MKWLDISEIAEALEEKYPHADVENLSFPVLKEWILTLPEFSDKKEGCNEKILEAVQMAWLGLRDVDYETDDL
ncbi:MAG: Fe-S cluster assembly protein IscX [Alphaproteobacteria bacterium]|jgi:FeS assembly protein IscX|nr:Fe-S cluster assembly protein IscX [Alphaproteobacteria bacterium]